MSSATFYGWKARFGGLDMSDAKKLKGLEDETSRLKRLLADAMLERAIEAPWARAQWRAQV